MRIHVRSRENSSDSRRTCPCQLNKFHFSGFDSTKNGTKNQHQPKIGSLKRYVWGLPVDGFSQVIFHTGMDFATQPPAPDSQQSLVLSIGEYVIHEKKPPTFH